MCNKFSKKKDKKKIWKIHRSLNGEIRSVYVFKNTFYLFTKFSSLINFITY